jgi:hypothetical protein
MNHRAVADVYKGMMSTRYWLVMLAPLCLAACAPTAQQQADYNAVERSGVSPAIYDKMVHDDALSVSDVASLSRTGVNDGIIVRYIRDHGTVYVLSPDEINYLRNNHVSPSVIDFMVQTGGGAYPYGPGPYGPGPVIYPPPVSIGIGFGGGRWR